MVTFTVTSSAQQEIKVSPSNVNVYSQGATTYFLTYGNLDNYRPIESQWCGELAPAAPDLGMRCAPQTIYGSLPVRYNQARLSGNNGYTDIVSVPAAIARKAYQAAARGEDARFYYVRRFVNQNGGPDQYTFVTLRLTGNGAGVPFSLTDVRMGFGKTTGLTGSGSEPQVLFVEPNGKLPPIRAELTYTGTGRLVGRWEIVQPGEELPERRDLLTEAALPIEERGSQKRYRQLARFNIFLPPGGKFVLPGPDPAKLPAQAEGQYLILLRVEASDDRENDSDLAAAGAGVGVVHSGAVAGFPLPVLRYVVGGGDHTQAVAAHQTSNFAPLLPRDGATLPLNQPVDFVWSALAGAAVYRLEIEDEAGALLHSALLQANALSYRAPSWLKSKARQRALQWRVVALDKSGTMLSETGRRSLRFSVVR
ncbi:MAG: hypothetical protein HY011_17400 [Acidobacteria bacterium]|nr:hypothetical protein [Acidobacteriota bacterium]